MKIKKNSNNASERIELRSEKVRNIIGTIPSILVHCGIAIVVIIFIALLLIIFFIPYPYGVGESIYQHLFLL